MTSHCLSPDVAGGAGGGGGAGEGGLHGGLSGVEEGGHHRTMPTLSEPSVVLTKQHIRWVRQHTFCGALAYAFLLVDWWRERRGDMFVCLFAICFC